MAVDALIKRLVDERDQKVALIETLAGTAEDEGRDLYETDLETIENAKSRIRALDAQIDKVGGDLEMADSVKQRVSRLDPQIIGRDFQYRTAGQYLWDALHKHDDKEAQARWGKFHSRAAEHLGLDKANTVPVAGGFNGLVVTPNQGAILDPHPGGRPLFSALGVNPVTSSQFGRPRIIDASLTTGVGPQGQEKSELVSKTWDIVTETVRMTVYGGYINVSELLLDMISSSLDMVVSHMNRRLEIVSEMAAINVMDNTTDSVAVTDGNIMAAIGDASALVFANTGQLPTWLAMGPQGWAALLGLMDAAGRPLFPPIGPANALGQGDATDFTMTIAGLRTVVTYGIADTTLYVGNRYGLEVYEKRHPVMQAIEPSVFGRQIAVATSLGFYSPITTEAGPGDVPPAERNGVVKITGLT
jgi:HK97 family phage major capsid protein